MRSLFAACAALIVAVAAARGSQQSARAIELAGQIELTDQLGRHFTLADLRGRPLVVSFVSAHCTDVCPLIDAQISGAAEHERTNHGPLRFLTITLDPQHDTHEDLAHLARVFNADERYWRIAGGAPDVVAAYMQWFGIRTARNAGGELTGHTSAVFVLDSTGHVAEALLPSAHLADDIERLEVR